MESVPFLPYGRQWIDEDDIEAVVTTMRSEFLTQGPQISEFENEIAQYTGARFAVAVSNGTAALHLAVLALDLPAGSCGVTHPNTFVATSNALIYAGHTPSFVDIDPTSYVMDPDALAARLSAGGVHVVLPVHFAGNTTGLEEIATIAKVHGVRIIEDAAHAIGGQYSDGRRVGSCAHSDMTIFSFHPVKTMTTAEGGAITTNDRDLYRRLLMLRTHGITKDPLQLSHVPGPWYYEMQTLGYNYRMTDIQAALGRRQLSKLDRFVSRRQEIVARYNEEFSDLPWLTLPESSPAHHVAWHLYVLQVDWTGIGMDRSDVMLRLRESGVGSQVLYIPVHLQPYYRKEYGFSVGDFPIAEQYYERALAIPLYPAMSDGDQGRVVRAVQGLA